MTDIERWTHGEFAPLSEWKRCLHILGGVSSFLDGMNRSGLRLDADFPDEELQAIKAEVDNYLYPMDGPAPFERVAVIEGTPTDDATNGGPT